MRTQKTNKPKKNTQAHKDREQSSIAREGVWRVEEMSKLCFSFFFSLNTLNLKTTYKVYTINSFYTYCLSCLLNDNKISVIIMKSHNEVKRPWIENIITFCEESHLFSGNHSSGYPDFKFSHSIWVRNMCKASISLQVQSKSACFLKHTHLCPWPQSPGHSSFGLLAEHLALTKLWQNNHVSSPRRSLY